MFKFIAATLVVSVSAYRPIEGTNPWDKEVPKGPTVDFPYNYKVANFGLDHDIRDTNNNLEGAEKALKTKWTPKQDAETGHWDTGVTYE